MSRCFPFPPPGYEKKPKSVEHEDLLAKELKEKKHKKKRDKEKRESKERKDKDSSKDKHKEKKERKVKHKDGKKDKGKSRISEDQRTEQSTEIPHEVKPKHDRWKVERIKDSKFFEELGRRIRDEEQGAANQMGEVLTDTTQRGTNTIVSSTVMPNENIRSDKMVNDIIGTVVNDIIGTVQRRNENVSPSVQKRVEDMGSAAALEKQRASNDKSPNFISTERKRNGSLIPPVHKRIESNSAAVEKQRIASNQKVSGVSSTEQRRNNVTAQPIDNFSVTVQKGIEDQGTATASEEQRDFISTERKRNESLIPSIQKRTDTLNNSIAMEKQRVASNEKVGVFNSTEQRRNIVTGGPADNFTNSVHRTERKFTTNSVEKERVVVSNAIRASAERKYATGQLPESAPSLVQTKIARTGAAATTEKQRVTVPNVICTEKRFDSTGQKIEKDTDKKKDKEEKKKEKKKGEGHKDRDRKEKRKEKDKGQRNEKEKEEEKVKILCQNKHVDHGKVRQGDKDNQINKTFTSYQNNVKPADKLREHENKDHTDCPIINLLASHQNNVKLAVVVANGNIKKRKEQKINGLLHEPQSNGRPNKLLRTYTSSFHPPVENGKILESSHFTSPCSSLKLEDIDNTKAERGLDSSIKTLSINGKTVGQASPIVLKLPPPPPIAEDLSTSTQVLSKSLHPDSKYLCTIYSVPKLEELLEYDDDDEWLLNSENPRPRNNVEADGTAQVSATGMQVEAADVFVLPYVVPL